MCLQFESLENTVGKRKIARNEQFLLFPQCFLPYWRRFRHFHEVWNCRPQTLSVWKSLKLSVWEMVIEWFLAPLAVGQRAYVMARCPSCVRPSVRPSVRALTFSLNIFFAETTYRILMKFHRNVPTMVLFRISWNNLIPSKTLVAMATKLKIVWNLWKSSCQKP